MICKGLFDVLNPPETIFPESNKGATLSSSGKNVDHVDYERLVSKRKRRITFIIQLSPYNTYFILYSVVELIIGK